MDFQDLTPEILAAIAKINAEGFKDSDVVSFTHVDSEMEDRVKVILNDILFLVKKSSFNDALEGRFGEDYFKSLPRGEESCDAEFCD